MYPRIPDLADVAAIVAVDRHGSISAAARATGIHQQTMSARVARAEKLLGLTLFHRSPYGTETTNRGRTLIDAATGLLDAAQGFATTVTHLHDDTGPRDLTVAVSNTVAELYFPDWAARFHSSHLSVRLSMMQANSAQVCRLVEDGTAALGIVEGGPVTHSLEESVLGHDDLVVAVPADHPWAAPGRAVTARELRATPLVVREPGSGTRQVVEAVLGQLTEPAGEFGSLAAQRAAISSLNSPGIIAAGAVSDQIALGRLVRVHTPGVEFRRRLRAVRRRQASFQEDAAVLLAIARAHPPAPPAG